MLPHDVEADLSNLRDRLEKGVTLVAALDGKATRLRREHDRAYALAFIGAEGAMDIRRYLAVRDTYAQREAAEDAEVELRHAKELLRAVSTQVDIVRSIGTSVRSSLAAS